LTHHQNSKGTIILGDTVIIVEGYSKIFKGGVRILFLFKNFFFQKVGWSIRIFVKRWG
jgi:hypothetical protein